MKVVKINAEELKSIKALHLLLQSELGFPVHYGQNLDALWDCLTDEIGLPVLICWTNYAEDNFEGQAKSYLELFRKAAMELEGFYFQLAE